MALNSINTNIAAYSAQSNIGVALLLVVTVHRQSNGVKLSVNARAPIFISTLRRVATQYVFHNNKYEIQHLVTF